MKNLPIILLFVFAFVIAAGFAISAGGGECRRSADGISSCSMAAVTCSHGESFTKTTNCCAEEEFACDRSGKRGCQRARKCEGKQDGECRKGDSCEK